MVVDNRSNQQGTLAIIKETSAMSWDIMEIMLRAVGLTFKLNSQRLHRTSAECGIWWRRKDLEKRKRASVWDAFNLSPSGEPEKGALLGLLCGVIDWESIKCVVGDEGWNA